MSQILLPDPRASNSINVDKDVNRISVSSPPLKHVGVVRADLAVAPDSGVSSAVPIPNPDSINTVCKVFTSKLVITTADSPNAKVSESVKVRRPNNSIRIGNNLASGSDSPRCMRYNCRQKSKNGYNKCFCSEECQDIVFENSHSAGVVLIGLNGLPYSVILKGRMEDLKSNEEWEAPGGVRERSLSETAIGCAIRECVEETGMVIKVDKMAKYLLRCPMVAMSIKSETRFSGIYHLAILAHILGFNDLNMHQAWISRMDRYTRKEVDKSGRPVVRSDCVDMEYSAALDLPALWMATTKFRSSGHPRKSAKILRTTVEDSLRSPASQGAIRTADVGPHAHRMEPPPVASRVASPTQQEVILCYRDYWSMSRIHDRGLIETVMAMPTLEQLGIWDQTFIS